MRYYLTSKAPEIYFPHTGDLMFRSLMYRIGNVLLRPVKDPYVYNLIEEANECNVPKTECKCMKRCHGCSFEIMIYEKKECVTLLCGREKHDFDAGNNHC